MDGRTEGVEFFLVAGHDADRAVRVQIIGDVPQFEEAALHFRQRPGKQIRVVGLEVDLPAELQHLLVFFQKGVVRQAALGVLLARPGVAEVDIEQVDLVVGKELVDIRRVEREIYFRRYNWRTCRTIFLW